MEKMTPEQIVTQLMQCEDPDIIREALQEMMFSYIINQEEIDDDVKATLLCYRILYYALKQMEPLNPRKRDR